MESNTLCSDSISWVTLPKPGISSRIVIEHRVRGLLIKGDANSPSYPHMAHVLDVASSGYVLSPALTLNWVR